MDYCDSDDEIVDSKYKTNKMVFTINHYTPDDVIKVRDCEKATAIVAGLEVGPKNGVPHIQGAVIWPSKMTFRAAQKKLDHSHGGKCYTNKMKGLWKHQAYCKKDGMVIREDEYEDGPGQGRRTDIIKLRDAVKRGATDDELWMDQAHNMSKYMRCADHMRVAFQTAACPDRLPPGSKGDIGIWMWGDSNVGKTTFYELWNPGFYDKNCTCKAAMRWWDLYDSQEVVLIDDPPADVAPKLWDYLKQWVQEKPFLAQACTGGKQRKIRFKKLIVCSNYSPSIYFGPTYEESIFRSRFTVIHQVRKLYCKGQIACALFPDCRCADYYK